MCGRYTLTDPHDVQLRFEVEGWAETAITPRFNVAPSQLVPVVVERPEGRMLEVMTWGFQPAWMKAGKRPAPINARAESLLERPMFRTAVPRHRCIIPADGFFEWQAVVGQKRKRPHYIKLKDGGLFGFAGIYAGSDAGPSVAIITTEPNELMEPIHDRMPAILAPDDEAAWLSLDQTDPIEALTCLRPYPAEAMTTYEVSDLVSSARNDGPELIRPLDSTP